MAELAGRASPTTAAPAEADGERPFPPGDYPVVIVGSGPGGLQASYSLRRLGIDHAVISADPAPGGMFRRFPFFQRLLSWTKPYAPVPRSDRWYEWFDWNSLLADEPAATALMPTLMDGSSSFPSRPEMEANLAAYAERAGVRVRYGCRWEQTRRDGERFVLQTSDGEYRCRAAVFAVGVAEPWKPDTPGFEDVAHYAETRAAADYAGKRLFLVGKENSAFELATGLLPWAQRIVLASPRPAKLSVNSFSLAGIRARYIQPVEDEILGGGVFILNASIDRIERLAGGAFRVHCLRSEGGGELKVEADEVIAATGWTCPLLDLPENAHWTKPAEDDPHADWEKPVADAISNAEDGVNDIRVDVWQTLKAAARFTNATTSGRPSPRARPSTSGSDSSTKRSAVRISSCSAPPSAQRNEKYPRHCPSVRRYVIRNTVQRDPPRVRSA